MANRAKLLRRRFLTVLAIAYSSAVIVILGQYVNIPSAVLTFFTGISTFFITGFALTWAIEGSAFWGMSKTKIIMWSLLLSFGLNFPILFILNFIVGLVILPIILIELLCALGFSFIGYKREMKAWMKPVIPQTESRCHSCGSPVKPEDYFCHYCGVSLRAKLEGTGVEDGLT